MPVLTAQKDAYAKEVLSNNEYPYILILINDLKSCFDKISDVTVRRLTNVVMLGKGLHVLMIVNGDVSAIEQLHFGGDKFTSSLVQRVSALLIGGSIGTHKAFNIDIPISEASAILEESETYFLLRKFHEQ